MPTKTNTKDAAPEAAAGPGATAPLAFVLLAALAEFAPTVAERRAWNASLVEAHGGPIVIPAYRGLLFTELVEGIARAAHLAVVGDGSEELLCLADDIIDDVAGANFVDVLYEEEGEIA